MFTTFYNIEGVIKIIQEIESGERIGATSR